MKPVRMSPGQEPLWTGDPAVEAPAPAAVVADPLAAYEAALDDMVDKRGFSYDDARRVLGDPPVPAPAEEPAPVLPRGASLAQGVLNGTVDWREIDIKE